MSQRSGAAFFLFLLLLFWPAELEDSKDFSLL